MRRALLLCLCAVALRAQSDPAPTESDFTIPGFTFRAGGKVDLKLHYLTIGKPQRDINGRVHNAILLLHGTGASSAHFLASGFLGALFLPGQPLDAEKYFLILPDAIGHGDSSKPSDGLHAAFPSYDYEDMVRANYRLLHDRLGVDHLRLVLGVEMGGMQAWLWGERHPDFVDALLPLACAPAPISGRQRIYRDMVADAIQSDPAWNNGEYTAPPRGLLAAQFVMYLMTQSPLQLERFAPTGDIADSQFQAWRRRALRLADANDLLYQFAASRTFDPTPDLPRIHARVLAINFADDELNPPELHAVEHAIEHLPNASYVLIPTSEETRGVATAMRARVWRDHLATFLR